MKTMKEYRPYTQGQWIVTRGLLEQGKIPMIDLQTGGGVMPDVFIAILRSMTLRITQTLLR